MRLELEYDLPEPLDVLPVAGGRGALPYSFVVRRPATAQRPEVSLTVEVRDGAPGCTCASIDITPGQPPLSTKELRNLRLPEMLEQAIRDNLWQTATGDEALHDGSPSWFVDNVPGELVDEVVGSIWRRREAVSTDRLQLVAAAHRDGGVEQVQRRLNRTRSQAFRLVARAREAGLIEPSSRIRARHVRVATANDGD